MPIGPFGYQIGNGSWHGMVRWTSGTGKNNDLYIFWNDSKRGHVYQCLSHTFIGDRALY